MDTNFFSEKFTYHLKKTLLRAFAIAVRDFENEGQALRANENKLISNKAPEVTIENLLESLKFEQGSIAAEVLNKTSRSSRKQADDEQTFINAKNQVIRLSQEVSEALLKAVHISNLHRHKYVGTEHLLQSLAQDKNPKILQWLEKEKIRIEDLEKNLQIVMESTSKFPDLTAVFSSPGTSPHDRETDRKSALLYFGRELTNAEVQKEIDPLIGREQEVERLIQILCRRHKNNPILLGEAGVGKTAIVEGLAKKISQGDVPPILAGKKIFTVDLGSMVAGTVYRGEFEARLKNLIESAEADGNAILFIDEIHTVIGAGSASGSLDAANMLKPSLARGRISVIGATTVDEYKKHIEPDSALERRFQVILVDEPSEEETVKVLEGVKENYEKFHNVYIEAEAIRTAVRLSNRYLTDKLQPDKALDLIDETAAKAKVKRSQKSIWLKIRSAEEDLKKVVAKKKEAVSKEKYSLAIGFKKEEEELTGVLEALREKSKKEDEFKAKITADDIFEVVAAFTKIPLGSLKNAERDLYGSLEENLRQRIVGQERQLAVIASLVRRGRANISDPNKPLASFIFLGPSGVGKTETAKQLARVLFQDKNALIRVDMSEFAESFTVSNLVGAPAGYVGYRDGNKFTDLVRRKPYSVILLDEIEKAHPEVFNLLLQVLEDGALTDATGRKVNFRNTIIIMTSNIGLDEFNRASRLGFGQKEETQFDFAKAERAARENLKNHFRPEFLGRIDKVIVFNPLLEEALQKIVDLYAQDLARRLEEKNITLLLSPAARGHLAKQGFSPEAGARGIRRLFQDEIETEIAKTVLTEADGKNKVQIDVKDDKLAVEII